MYYTSVTLPSFHKKIKHDEPVLTAGSCFADCMGKKFEEFKFSTLTNPFGTVYNPLSLHRQFQMAIDRKILGPEKVAEVHGMYVHYDFHSSFRNISREALLNDIQQDLDQVHDFLKKSSWLVITWGTAWVYELKKENEIVANCHKQPGKIFDKKLLNLNDILADFNAFHKQLKSFNPDINIILTVSPVRHIKDTLSLNNVSKSLLRLAAHEITEKNTDVFYFPSYEIMMDELRDYRFYKEDMIHPTLQAEDYIWNKFTQVAIDGSALDFIEKWKEIRKAMTHKPFNPESEGHRQFLTKTMDKLLQLKRRVNVDEEIEYLKKQL
ncbi:MAG: GSCFA domain-containing protein [Candidatus Cyclobacteriaceae bacterium M2_1C_046]